MSPAHSEIELSSTARQRRQPSVNAWLACCRRATSSRCKVRWGPARRGSCNRSQLRSGAGRSFVVSPTFTLIHEYDGELPVYHVDAYRLKNSDEFLDMGGGELLSGEGVCLIEWADRIGDLLPRDHLRIEIDVTEEQSRVFRIRASGPLSQRVVDRLR